MYAIALGVVLAAVWLLWSGHTDALLLSFGAVSVAATVGLSRRLGLLDDEGVPLGPLPRFLAYQPWLVLEIFKANVDVARRILSPSMPIRPSLIRVRASQKTDVMRVLYANSITLTPGTVTLEVEEDVLTIHALTDEAAAGVFEGTMDRKVARVESGR